jgi:hypothetical protein
VPGLEIKNATQQTHLLPTWKRITPKRIDVLPGTIDSIDDLQHAIYSHPFVDCFIDKTA